MKTLITLIAVALSLNVMAINDDNKKDDTNSSNNVTTATVKGVVVDKTTGEALVGVAVIMNNQTVAYSDFDGNFTVNVNPNSNADLKLNFISYETTTVNVNGKNNLKVELKSVNN